MELGSLHLLGPYSRLIDFLQSGFSLRRVLFSASCICLLGFTLSFIGFSLSFTGFTLSFTGFLLLRVLLSASCFCVYLVGALRLRAGVDEQLHTEQLLGELLLDVLLTSGQLLVMHVPAEQVLVGQLLERPGPLAPVLSRLVDVFTQTGRRWSSLTAR